MSTMSATDETAAADGFTDEPPTTVVESDTAMVDGTDLAWSQAIDTDDEPGHRSWVRTAALATGIVAAGSAIAAGLWLGVPGFKQAVTNRVAPQPTSSAAPSTVAAAPTPKYCAPGHNADRGCLPVVVAAPPTVTVTPTTLSPQDRDARFVALVAPKLPAKYDEGLPTVAQSLCRDIAEGNETKATWLARLLRNADDVTVDGGTFFVNTAVQMYCPQYR